MPVNTPTKDPTDNISTIKVRGLRRIFRLIGDIFYTPYQNSKGKYLALKIFGVALGNQYLELSKPIDKTILGFLRSYYTALKIDIRNIKNTIKNFSTDKRKRICSSNLNTTRENTEMVANTPQYNEITRSTLEHSHFIEEDIKITFYASCRRLGNPNSDVGTFLESVIRYCDNAKQIEVLIAIDHDDDIAYFTRIKERYAQQIRLRIFISGTRFGYQKLHLYDRELFKHIAKNTKMLCDFSDDCRIRLAHFDTKLLEVDAKHPDNIYVIHTQESNRQDFLGNVSENILLLFWVQQTKAPASYFPIFSKKILDIANEYAQQFDKNNEWSPLCNAWICDCYIDILSVYMKSYGLDRIHSFEMVKMNDGPLTPHQKPRDQYGLTPNNIAFIKMLSTDTQDYLKGLAKMIAIKANPALQSGEFEKMHHPQLEVTNP